MFFPAGATTISSISFAFASRSSRRGHALPEHGSASRTQRTTAARGGV